MTISIIIVSWNAREFLAGCLASIYRDLRGYDAEIIVVDNDSNDGSPEMVSARYPEVMLIINDANLGFARANNIGLRQCKGRYIFLINSDVEIVKGFFETMISYMEQHEEIGMLGPRILNPDGTLQHSCKGLPSLWNSLCRASSVDTLFPRSKLFGGRLMRYWPHDAVRSVEMLSGCLMMIRRNALEEVGFLDERFFIYAEDIDWCKRFHDAGWDIVFLPYAQAFHYGGASSKNAPVQFYVEMQKADIKYWEKHHRRLTWLSYMMITVLHQLLRICGHSIQYIMSPSKRGIASLKIERSMSYLWWLCRK